MDRGSVVSSVVFFGGRGLELFIVVKWVFKSIFKCFGSKSKRGNTFCDFLASLINSMDSSKKTVLVL